MLTRFINTITFHVNRSTRQDICILRSAWCLLAKFGEPIKWLCLRVYSSHYAMWGNGHIVANIGDIAIPLVDYESQARALQHMRGGLVIRVVGENSIFGFC